MCVLAKHNLDLGHKACNVERHVIIELSNNCVLI